MERGSGGRSIERYWQNFIIQNKTLFGNRRCVRPDNNFLLISIQFSHGESLSHMNTTLLVRFTTNGFSESGLFIPEAYLCLVIILLPCSQK